MFTRDSKFWPIGLATAVIAGIAGLRACDPHAACVLDPTMLGYYGIPDSWAPYLRLYSLIAGPVNAWMMTSPRPHSIEGDAKITPSGR